ncbi:MAG: PQQ-binding-like beta-propeller repeat protein [Candidatus Solibacter usitatus]|nr:PQQ-binding-like beta-propeller repeat protein [Candidatus Solibacter usitatus]
MTMQRREWMQVLAGAALATPLTAAGKPADWPQWRGVNRDGKSPETGLLKSWPEKGPAVAWHVKDLGSGYGSMSVVGNRVFLQGGTKPKSVVHCLDRATGQKVWTIDLGRYRDQNRGDGPRGTPTVEGDKFYALSEDGDLICANAEKGAEVWRKNILKEFNGSNPGWLISESPLIDGQNLIVTPGGPDASIAALDKTTGATKWTSKGVSDRAGYASCIAVNVGNVRVILALTSKAGMRHHLPRGQHLRLFECNLDVHGFQHGRCEVDRPRRRQGLHHVRRRTFLCAGRKAHHGFD